MYCIDNEKCRFADFFGWCGDSMIPSYFEGHTGSAVAENENDPRWVIIRTGDYYFAAGQPENIADAVGGFIKPDSVVISEEMSWLDALRECGADAKAVTRYRTVYPGNGFSREKLEGFLRTDGCVSIKRAGEREYPLLRDCEWENAFVMNFADMEDFLKNGLGYCVFVGDELASAATAYGYYSGGFEIQIATAPKFRRRGLAAAAGAAFLLECLGQGKTPHWDAANMTSVRIAQRLGFEYGGEYTAIGVGELRQHRTTHG